MMDPEAVVKDIAKLFEILNAGLDARTQDHPGLASRFHSILPPSLVLTKTAKHHFHGKTFVVAGFKTRDGRRSIDFPVPLATWFNRMAITGDPCKAAIRIAKKILYHPQRGTWAQRTRSGMTEGGW